MKKLVQQLALTAILIAAPIQQSKAVIAAVTSIWNPPAAITLAYIGVASPVVGTAAYYIFSKEKGCNSGVCIAGLVLGSIVGLIFLEETGTIEFSKLSEEQALKLGIKINQAEIYNSEIEEVNILLKEVASQLDEKSSLEATQLLWEEYSEHVSAETFDVMITIVNNSLK